MVTTSKESSSIVSAPTASLNDSLSSISFSFYIKKELFENSKDMTWFSYGHVTRAPVTCTESGAAREDCVPLVVVNGQLYFKRKR